MWLVVAWSAQHEVKVDRREACPPRGFGAARVVGGAVRPRAEQRVALDAQALRLGPLHDARDASLLGELINHAYLVLLKRAAVMLCAMRVAACTNRAMRGFVRRVPGRAPRSATLGSTQTATTRSRSSARHRFRSAAPPQTSCAGHLSTAITRPTIRSGHCERVYARADSSVSP